MKKLIVLAAAVGFVLTTALPALAWSFDVSASCRVFEEEGVYIVDFTIDNTSEPEDLNIIDQDPASGITSVPAGSTASWSLAIPLDTNKEGASWEVLGNWPSDQRPRHRVATVRFTQACPPPPPPTSTTTTSIPSETTTTAPSDTTTTTVPTPTTTVPMESTTTTTTVTPSTPTTEPPSDSGETPPPSPPTPSRPQLPYTGLPDWMAPVGVGLILGGLAGIGFARVRKN